MRRLGVVEEQLFSFRRDAGGNTPVASVPEVREKEVVVVELPPPPEGAAETETREGA